MSGGSDTIGGGSTTLAKGKSHTDTRGDQPLLKVVKNRQVISRAEVQLRERGLPTVSALKAYVRRPALKSSSVRLRIELDESVTSQRQR